MNETACDCVDRFAIDWVHHDSVTAAGTNASGGKPLFRGRGKMVHAADGKVDGTTEIRWSYVYEVFECIKCHKIMEFNFGFGYCPYCGRKVVRTDERRISLGESP